MIVALVSKKGGVGKTTTSVNLAAALNGLGKRALVVDLDSQGSTSLSFGLTRDQFAPSVADVLLGNTPMAEAIRPTSVPGLDLVTSSADLSRADQTLAGFAGRERILQSKLAHVRDRYDYILLDCPPSLSVLSIGALVASDGYIMPVTPHYLALEGLRNLINAAERLCHNNSTRTRLLGVLLTMVDYRNRVTRQNIDRIREEYRRLVFAIEIRINVRLAEAPSFGQTIFQYDPTSTGAKAYRLLAEEMMLRLDSPHAELRPEAADAADTYRTPPGLAVTAST